jgi:ATP-dependent protease HslVU (ClpYQ) peptidase subunit
LTTVAFDGKTLAADSGMVYEGVKYKYSGKIRRLSNGCLAGFAGDVDNGQLLLDWLDGDRRKKLPVFQKEDDADAILITPTGQIAFCGISGVLLWLDDKIMALGTGGNLALGAMLAGTTAVEAVKIAILRDPNSGFDVISIDL